jgi:tRNA U34 5-methylaminomethyl-2-thiouridine-forming methyltransferase MnmC
MTWTRVVTGDGSITLAHPRHDETCHSRAGAWTQARERYARACRLRERARELGERGSTRFRLLDVGTGLGLNIAAAVEAVEPTGIALEVTSLEIDASVIEAAIAIGPQPILDLERIHAGVRAALARALDLAKSGAVTNDSVSNVAVTHGAVTNGAADLGEHHRLHLHLGDARTTLASLDPTPGFDAVFLDPFSPGVDPNLWEPDTLRAIARLMAPHSLLSTYSAAVRVRVGLRAAGLHVGPGPRVQEKAQGTLAGPNPLAVAFDARTQRRLDAKAAHLTALIPCRTGIPRGNGLRGSR